MANPIRYIKDLEAAGFARQQAEAQVQMVFDAIEDNLVTKNDFTVFQERMDHRFAQFEQRIEARMSRFEQYMENRFEQFQKSMEARFAQLQLNMEARFAQFEQTMDGRFVQFQQVIAKQMVEMEFRMTIRLAVVLATTTSLTMALLSWIK